MATVLPAEFPGDHSKAEHLIYRKLRDETPPDWTALHSVGLANHDRKLWAEVDFVVLTDHAVLCLEVKGGQLSVQKGRWFAGDRALTHTPFEQAGGAASALRRFLREHLGDQTPVIGWGVVFPSTRFELVCPEADRVLVYDDNDRTTPLHVYLDRLTTHWARQDPDRDRAERIDVALHQRIVELLAPTFDLHATLRSRVRGVGEELVRLTSEQSEFLRGFAETERLVLRGGAGTGKTLLALAESERLAVDGRRVLFSCANGRLAADLSIAMRNHPSVKVVSAYELATSLIAAAEASDRIPATASTREVLQIHLPEVALSVLPRDHDAACSALVLDEAQDLISPYWLELFGALLEGGIHAGWWRVFLDPNQNLILGSHPDSEDALDAAATSRYRLRTNCRNTREIATGTALLTGLATLDTLKVTGPEVADHWYTSSSHQRDLAISVLREWLARGLDPSQITVLSGVAVRQSVMNGVGERELGAPLVDLAVVGQRPHPVIAFATIADFKGFESDAVLVTDITDLSAGQARFELYVAMTRARALLALLIARGAEAQYQALAADFAERVGAGLIRPQ
jgi:hypothetical protein